MATPVNGIYVLQGIVPADIAAAPVGVKVVDLYDDNGQLFSASQVAQMAAGNGQLLGYFSIGEAENYRSYFASLPKSALGPVDPSWPGDYEVAYWTDAWKTVSTNYIDQMLSLGYEGAYFDVVDECETPWAQSHAPGGDAKGAMVNLVKYLADYAHAKNPNFKIWVNTSGSEDMLTNSTFVNSINGAFEEELFYQDSGAPQPASETSYNLGLLHNLVAAGKSVVAIEYVTGAAKVADVQAKAAAAGIGSYIASPNLELDGVDKEGFATLSNPTTPTPPSTPIDTTAPTVVGIAAAPNYADLGVGGHATITLKFSETVKVTGVPKLSLNDGGSATYASGSGTNTLSFSYTVAQGQNTSDLAVTGVTLPAGAKVADAAGNAANLTKAVGNPSGKLMVDTLRTRTTVLTGTGQTVNAGTGNDIVRLSGGNATLVFHGSNNVAFLGGTGNTVNATINDQSHGLNVFVQNAGVDKISGLAADPTAVVDLLGGVGGYTSVTQVLKALTTDHAGGTLLPLGGGRSIDFTGIAPTSLHAANFKVE